MDSQILTLLHVAITLIAILSGLVVAYGLVTDQRMTILTAIFLVFTLLTGITGFFFFHRDQLTPAQITGVILAVTLLPAMYGLYLQNLRGIWRGVYIIGAVVSLYLNVFVLVIQSFQKIPFLNALAPTQTTEPAFAETQGAVLLLFIVIGAMAYKRFRPVIFA